MRIVLTHGLGAQTNFISPPALAAGIVQSEIIQFMPPWCSFIVLTVTVGLLTWAIPTFLTHLHKYRQNSLLPRKQTDPKTKDEQDPLAPPSPAAAGLFCLSFALSTDTAAAPVGVALRRLWASYRNNELQDVPQDIGEMSICTDV